MSKRKRADRTKQAAMTTHAKTHYMATMGYKNRRRVLQVLFNQHAANRQLR